MLRTQAKPQKRAFQKQSCPGFQGDFVTRSRFLIRAKCNLSDFGDFIFYNEVFPDFPVQIQWNALLRVHPVKSPFAWKWGRTLPEQSLNDTFLQNLETPDYKCSHCFCEKTLQQHSTKWAPAPVGRCENTLLLWWDLWRGPTHRVQSGQGRNRPECVFTTSRINTIKYRWVLKQSWANGTF